MSETHDPRAADVFWRLLAEPKLSPRTAPLIERGLLITYLGGNMYTYVFPVDPPTGSPASIARRQQEFVRAVKLRAASGAERQRLVAIALLTYATDEKAVDVVQRLRDDAAQSRRVAPRRLAGPADAEGQEGRRAPGRFHHGRQGSRVAQAGFAVPRQRPRRAGYAPRGDLAEGGEDVRLFQLCRIPTCCPRRRRG